MKALLTVVLVLLMSACVQKPTTTSEVDLSILDRAYSFEKGARPIRLTPDTIILDVRSFFEYQMAHLPGALHIDHKEFSLRRLRGDDLELKARTLSRRLALLGITPFSHIVVVGYGEKGQGEEGSLATSLMIMGIERVQVGTLTDLNKLTTKESPQHPNARYWEPLIVYSLLCPPQLGKDESFVINVGKKQSLSTAFTPRRAFLQKDWKDFVNVKDFSANPAVKSQLAQEGAVLQSRLMVRGPQAPLVVFSLLQLGYSQSCMMDD